MGTSAFYSPFVAVIDVGSGRDQNPQSFCVDISCQRGGRQPYIITRRCVMLLFCCANENGSELQKHDKLIHQSAKDLPQKNESV